MPPSDQPTMAAAPQATLLDDLERVVLQGVDVVTVQWCIRPSVPTEIHGDDAMTALGEYPYLPIPHLSAETPAMDQQDSRTVSDVADREPDTVPRMHEMLSHETTSASRRESASDRPSAASRVSDAGGRKRVP